MIKIIEKKQFYYTLLISIFSLTILITNFILNDIMISVGSGKLNQFAFFTIQSNIIVAIFFTITTVANFFGLKKIYYFLNLPYVRGTVTIWILITGIVFTFMLYPVFIASIVKTHKKFIIRDQFYQIALHMIIPVIDVINTLSYKYKKKTKFKYLFILAIIYPLVYEIIIEICGIWTKKYPYFFLNVHGEINGKMGNGYLAVILWTIVLILFFAIIIFFVTKKFNYNFKKNNIQK